MSFTRLCADHTPHWSVVVVTVLVCCGGHCVGLLWWSLCWSVVIVTVLVCCGSHCVSLLCPRPIPGQRTTPSRKTRPKEKEKELNHQNKVLAEVSTNEVHMPVCGIRVATYICTCAHLYLCIRLVCTYMHVCAL